MKDLIITIFGEYIPVSYQTTESLYDPSSGALISETVTDLIPSGAAGVDWTYVLGVLGFFVVLYCILRIIGSVINRV